MKLKSYIHHLAFYPGFAGLFVNPFYFARKGLLEGIQSLANHIQGDVLDIGCGRKPYRPLFNARRYVGLEFDTPENRATKQADFFYDGNTFPFDSGTFDALVCNQVLEHVFNPDLFLDEASRVLKQGGYFLVTVPFVWDEHEQPYDYARYSSFGLAALLKRHGFEVVRQTKTMADIRVIFQLINAYLFKKTRTRNAYFNMALTIILMAPLNILGEILAKITPSNQDLYLDNVILVRKV